jgi:branched-chain amino acid transport system substrate-binding protein
MGRRRTLFALLLILALIGTACAKKDGGGGTTAEGGKPTVKIAFMGALTGPNASLEIGPKNAAAMLIEQSNAKGDLPVKLEFQPEDTQGLPDPAKNIAQKLRGDDKVVGVIGPGFSGESKSAGDILEGMGVPRITPSATATSLGQRGWKHWFRGVASDAVQGGQTPDVILKYLKGTKVYIGHDKTEYGQGIAEIIQSKLKESAPNSLVGFEGADPGKDDYSALVTKAVSKQADVFYWGGYEPEALKIVPQLKSKGFKGTFVGGDGSKGSTIVSVKEAEGIVLTCPCIEPSSSQDESAKVFVQQYKAKYNEAPSVYAAEGHDTALVLIEAIRKAGAPGSDITAYREKVNANVKATANLKGISTTYAFQENGELAGTPAVLLYKVEGGAYKPLGLVSDLAK